MSYKHFSHDIHMCNKMGPSILLKPSLNFIRFLVTENLDSDFFKEIPFLPNFTKKNTNIGDEKDERKKKKIQCNVSESCHQFPSL